MVADEERRMISKRTKEALDWLPIRLQGERKLDKARQDRAQNPKPKTRWLPYASGGFSKKPARTRRTVGIPGNLTVLRTG
jgi:hypothetical protein